MGTSVPVVYSEEKNAFFNIINTAGVAPQTGDDKADCENCKWDKETVERLVFEVAGNDVQAWIDADDLIWRTFLAQQDGYKSKAVYVAQTCDMLKTDMCQVTSLLIWETLAQWKSLSSEVLSPIQNEFDEATKNLTQNYIRAQPNDWGFSIGAEHAIDIDNDTSDALNTQIGLMVLALLQV